MGVALFSLVMPTTTPLVVTPTHTTTMCMCEVHLLARLSMLVELRGVANKTKAWDLRLSRRRLQTIGYTDSRVVEQQVDLPFKHSLQTAFLQLSIQCHFLILYVFCRKLYSLYRSKINVSTIILL